MLLSLVLAGRGSADSAWRMRKARLSSENLTKSSLVRISVLGVVEVKSCSCSMDSTGALVPRYGPEKTAPRLARMTKAAIEVAARCIWGVVSMVGLFVFVFNYLIIMIIHYIGGSVNVIIVSVTLNMDG